MKNRLRPTNLFSDRRFALLLVVGCGILAMVPAFIWGIPAGADLDNHFRFMMPFYDEISHGNLAPGWLAESNFGFGDARFRFYPPVLYYSLSLFRMLTGGWYIATLAVFTLFCVIGAVGVYYWSRQNLSSPTSVCAALLFSFAPYHLTQFYQASLLAEFAATAFLPFAFLFVERITSNKSKGLYDTLFNIAGVAVSFSLIVTTHLPVTVIGSLALGLFALLSTDWKLNKKALIFAALGIALGLVLSSWFWVKMLSELDWIQAGEKVQSAYYDYRNNFIFSPFSPPNLNTYFAGYVAALTIGLFLPAVIVLRRLFTSKTDENSLDKYFAPNAENPRRRLRNAVLIALFSVFMTTDLSRPLWAVIPKLKDIQFPYRWLAVTSVVICPAIALSIQVWLDRIRQKNFRAIHIPVYLIFAAALFFSVKDLVIDGTFRSSEDFTRHIQEIRGAQSFNDWLPKGASELKNIQPLTGQIDPGNRQLVVASFQTHTRRFMLTEGDVVQVRLRSYYYPLWRATVLGTQQPTATAQAPDGTLLVAAPPEACEIEVTFTEPPRTKISYTIAALAWTFTLVLLIFGFFRRKPLNVL